MLGPDQITDVYEHYDALVGESRATAAELPATGNWLGRQIMAEDTGALYQCTALPGTWRRIWSPDGWAHLCVPVYVSFCGWCCAV